MKKFTSWITVCLIVLSTIGCAGNTAPTSGVSGVSIAIARAAAHIGLSVTLQRSGVSPENTSKILAELRTIVDAVLAGEDIRTVLTDPARWQPLRADLITRLATVIVDGATIDGVQLLDQTSAELLIGSLLDTFAASIRTH